MKYIHKSAFPIHVPDDGSYAEGFFDSGLTKREYFAAKAMQGILTSNQWPQPDHYAEIVKRSIAIADELLKQLEPKQ